MARSGVYILNVDSLMQLNDSIGHSGQMMSDIDANVSNYINGVREELESQLDSIRMRLEEAEARLSEAESACSACYASQMVMPETGILSPSCETEEIAVESARAEAEKWRVRYEQGQQIVRECQQEISDYTSGGHALILDFSQQQTPKACQRLSECIGNLQDILASSVVVDVGLNSDSMPEEPMQSISNEERVQAMKDRFRL